ncbi:hypothetical protein B4113_1408 [Geobacillus sp. B4113_201601]|nr:hypothetical protein B4113_1408 [Geobacillus sp. B4113_201601]
MCFHFSEQLVLLVGLFLKTISKTAFVDFFDVCSLVWWQQ